MSSWRPSRARRPPTASALRATLVLVLAVGCAPATGSLSAGPRPEVVRLQPGTTVRADGMRLEIPEGLETQYGPAIDTIRARLRQIGDRERTVRVRIRIAAGAPSSDAAVSRALDHPEGYVLRLDRARIRLDASSRAGALRGLSTLEEPAVEKDGVLPVGILAGRPDHAIRALHFTLRDVGIPAARRLVSLAQENQFNTLIVQLADGVAIPTLQKRNVARPDAWSLEEFAEFASYARGNGLEFVPELKLLTHQDKFFKGRYPKLMYNSKTYDPRDDRKNALVSRIVDDVIEAVGPEAIHIGYDEVAGMGPEEAVRTELEPGEGPLPARLFLADVRRVHRILGERDVETWMWGDMLLGASEFTGMLSRHLHGVPSYTQLRGVLPEGIVLCDWHYADRQSDFPSARTLLEAGHPVLGATWRRAATTRHFIRYLAGLDEPRARGMIATTWWLVQRERSEELVDLVEFSGEAFWNATAELHTRREGA